MKTRYTLLEIEHAISYWSAKERAPGIVLGPNVRILADVLGVMIYKRQTDVPGATLDQAQVDALDAALSAAPPLA